MDVQEYRRWLGVLESANASWRESWNAFAIDDSLCVDDNRAAAALSALEKRLTENYPFFHPRYAGQMIKPPHPIAAAAYMMAMQINPNNHALDGGPATAKMELEVVADIAAMFGFPQHLGHLTSSGTIANLEALWVARSLHPQKAIAYSTFSHYTHQRMCGVLNTRSVEISALPNGTIDCNALESELKKGTIGTVVVNLGSTSVGAVDPVHVVVPLCRKYGVRVHADGAYGGFFTLLARSKSPMIDHRPFLAVAECDSVVVDPHKHGLQPYGCGCVIFRNPSVGTLYKHDSPYTYFTSKELHLGEISLECSRAGASAAALWCTLQCLPLQSDDGLGLVLQKTRRAALRWSELIADSEVLSEYLPPQLDIVTYYPSTEPVTMSRVGDLSRSLFDQAMNRRERPIYLALLAVDASRFTTLHPDVLSDKETSIVLRSVLMKPEHELFVPEMFGEIEDCIRGGLQHGS
ncbi:MAG: aminotransferase class V-fold PLP-dependent enzyme [Ignavibacteriales bacterium]|nr:aminotransferase class V-fold PLP-dependent enzyme [Ignavibacteriales bacterium]